jgi:spermidine synthase
LENKQIPILLLLSVFVVATCGLIYELVAGTLASYLLGDSVTQFSTIIGVYLFSMGIGSYLSKFFNRNLIGWFIQIEILVGFIGGTSSSILFLLFEQVESFRILLYLLVSLTGTLVGLEIPLLMRILQGRFEFKDLVSQVFTFDYIGALLASIIFPLLLVPKLGLIKTSFFFGILNVLVALIVTVKFEKETAWAKYLKASSLATLALLLAGFVFSEKIMSFSSRLPTAIPLFLLNLPLISGLCLQKMTGSYGCFSMATCNSVQQMSTAIMKPWCIRHYRP